MTETTTLEPEHATLGEIREQPPMSLLEIEEEADNPPAPAKPLIELTEEQASAQADILRWFYDGEENPAHKGQFRLGGYAGTGKTTLAKSILADIADNGYVAAVCAPTGKAANVLRKKGVHDAKTIHSTIYRPLDPDRPSAAEWVLKRDYEMDQIDLFVVDEASMVATDLYNDLRSFNKPILFIGDPGQLEPVGENPRIMEEPDFVLQTIHRQAEGNPILQLAKAVREGGVPRLGFKHPQLVTTKWPLPMKNLLQADQVLCGTNAMRRNWNTAIRTEKGMRADKLVCQGEKLIVLRNDAQLGIYNGQILHVTEVGREYSDCIYVTAEDLDSDIRYRDLRLWKPGFEGVTPSRENRLPRKMAYVDYGYVITCHKSQGSEWDNVVVIDPGQIATWDMRRWRYTAITRAAKALIYCL